MSGERDLVMPIYAYADKLGKKLLAFYGFDLR
jgi:hypothetical protein